MIKQWLKVWTGPLIDGWTSTSLTSFCWFAVVLSGDMSWRQSATRGRQNSRQTTVTLQKRQTVLHDLSVHQHTVHCLIVPVLHVYWNTFSTVHSPQDFYFCKPWIQFYLFMCFASTFLKRRSVWSDCHQEVEETVDGVTPADLQTNIQHQDTTEPAVI